MAFCQSDGCEIASPWFKLALYSLRARLNISRVHAAMFLTQVLSEHRAWDDKEENKGDQSKSGKVGRHRKIQWKERCQPVLWGGVDTGSMVSHTHGDSRVWQVPSRSVLVLARLISSPVRAAVHALFERNWLW